jgi:hypothetical protein
VGEPAQVDPETQMSFCHDCPATAGQGKPLARKPVVDAVTGELVCMPCDGKSSCMDGMCKGGETCGSCSFDCGSCPPPPTSPYCGDDICNGGETGESCLRDCHASGPVLGRFARYCGKVNSHTSPDGTWTWDQDCSSGCNVGGLAYCQKFWPSATIIQQVNVSSKPNNVWANAYCEPVNDDYDGGDEFVCMK